MHLGVKDTVFREKPPGGRYRRWRADASLPDRGDAPTSLVLGIGPKLSELPSKSV